MLKNYAELIVCHAIF